MRIIDFIEIDFKDFMCFDPYEHSVNAQVSNEKLKEWLSLEFIFDEKEKALYSLLSVNTNEEFTPLDIGITDFNKYVFNFSKWDLNCSGVYFCSHIELNEIEETIKKDHSRYKEKFIYSNDNDYFESKKDLFKELNNFSRLEVYRTFDSFGEWEFYIGLEYFEDSPPLAFGVFVEKDKTPEFYKQYHREILKIYDRFNEGQANSMSELSNNTNGWSLRQRYELFNSLGFLDFVQKQNDFSEKEKHKVISYLFDCNIDNARKLFNGSYNKGRVNKDEITNLLKGYKLPKNK